MATSESNQDDAGEIVQRMKMLRVSGKVEVQKLYRQVDRVADWREHVRSNPVLATVASAAVGFFMIRAVKGRRVKPMLPQSQSQIQPSYESTKSVDRLPQRRSSTAPQAKTSTVSSLMSVAGGIAGTLVKQWLLRTLSNKLGAGQDGQDSGAGVKQRSPSPVSARSRDPR